MMAIKTKSYDDESRAGTWKISKGFQKEHFRILCLIEKYKVRFLELGDLPKSRVIIKTAGRPVQEYLLNYNQVVFLLALTRNTAASCHVLTEIIKTGDVSKALDLISNLDIDDIDVRFVYAVVDNSGRVKIGISNDPARRTAELNIGNADELRLIFTREIKGAGYSDEIALHCICEPFKIRSEWFHPEAIAMLQ